MLHHKAGMTKMETPIYTSIFSYWLSSFFFPEGLTPLILTDDLVSFEERALHEKLKCYHFSPNVILRMGHEHVVQSFNSIPRTWKSNQTGHIHKWYVFLFIKFIGHTSYCRVTLGCSWVAICLLFFFKPDRYLAK